MAGKQPVGGDQGSDRAVENIQTGDGQSAAGFRAEVTAMSPGDQRTAYNAMTQGSDTATQSFDANNPPTIVGDAGSGGAGGAVGDGMQSTTTVETTRTSVQFDNWNNPNLPAWGVDRMAVHNVGTERTETTQTALVAGTTDGGGTRPDETGVRADAMPARVADAPVDKNGDGEVSDAEREGKDDAEEGAKNGKKLDGTARTLTADAVALADAKDAESDGTDADGDGVSDRDEDLIGAGVGASDAASAAAGRGGRNGSRSQRREEAEQAYAAGSDEELEKTKLG